MATPSHVDLSACGSPDHALHGGFEGARRRSSRMRTNNPTRQSFY